MDLQGLGIYMGVWVFVLGATEASVSQSVVYSGLSEETEECCGSG